MKPYVHIDFKSLIKESSIPDHNMLLELVMEAEEAIAEKIKNIPMHSSWYMSSIAKISVTLR